VTSAGLRPADVDLEVIAHALAEDLGTGDLTAGIIPNELSATAVLSTREPMVVCGTAWFDAVFSLLDSAIEIVWHCADGDGVPQGGELCRVHGNAKAVLSGERTALNLLQTLSGTATRSREYARAVAGTGATVLDTRKTVPCLRLAQKYAVRCGGCRNHRHGLYDGILIKENHILAAGSIAAAVGSARALGAGVLIEVEVESLEELQQALQCRVERILLDNFTIDQIKVAVATAKGKAQLEVSGNVSLATIREVAETGVDFISVGDLTKNLRAIDLSLRIDLEL
jgi:nicotinate-nucleotide pyrophosphorylase (carboxylating)